MALEPVLPLLAERLGDTNARDPTEKLIAFCVGVRVFTVGVSSWETPGVGLM